MSETIVTSAPACRATAAASAPTNPAPTITSRGLRSSSVRRARECRLVALYRRGGVVRAAVCVNSIRSLRAARALVGTPWDTATKGGADHDRRP
jgi:hypothetical protein